MIGIIIITVLALILSVILVLLNDKVEEDNLVTLLPGYNCGACGYKSCAGMIDEALEDNEAVKNCRFLKGENLNKVLEILKNYSK